MDKENTIQKINKELKVYINESTFISNKCRNTLLKIFQEEFKIKLDLNNYKNVDLSINNDYNIIYRDDIYIPDNKIENVEELLNIYNSFKEKADKLITKKEIDFQNMNNIKNITNLGIIVCLLLLFIGIIILCINAFLVGRYFDLLWFIIIILPWMLPKLKENLITRLIQAKEYFKRLIKRIK